MSKGSSPRPYSVSQEKFMSNWDAIFNKEKQMSPSVEQMKKGTCGCGRSPTGDCIGWHSLTQESYELELSKYRETVFEEKTREE